MQTKTYTRRRPRLNATVAGDTLITLNKVRADTGLPNVGVAVDYVVTDWRRLKLLMRYPPVPDPVADYQPDED